MNSILEQINSIGGWFVEFSLPMLIQSSILIAILLLVDFLLRKKIRAVFRYWLWMLVLVKLVLPVSLSSPMSLGSVFGDRLTNVRPEIAADRPAQPQTPGIVEMPALPEASKKLDASGNESRSAEWPGAFADKKVVPALSQPTDSAITKSFNWQGLAFLIWLAVVGAMLLLLAQRVFFVLGLIRQAEPANGLMLDTLEFCRKRIGLKYKVGLKVSPNATSPAVCGLFRPVILVPQNIGPSLGAAHLRAVLMHELAHIKRGDLWVNLAQTLLQIVYFYNPLLWLANYVIRRVREQAVDEAVQVAMGERARDYPETLLNVAKLAFKKPALSLRLIGVVESKSALKTRIKRMLEREIPKTAKLGIAGLLVIVLAGAILLPMAKAEKNKATENTEKRSQKVEDSEQKTELQVIEGKELNLSIVIPADWSCYKNPAPGRYKFSWQLLPSKLKAWAMFIGSEFPQDELAANTPVRQIAVGDAAILKSYFNKYTVRADSWTEYSISEMPAVNYVADYVDEGTAMVEYRSYILSKSMVYWFVFRIEKDKFDSNKEQFDSIANSFKLSGEHKTDVKVEVEKIDSAEQQPHLPWEVIAHIADIHMEAYKKAQLKGLHINSHIYGADDEFNKYFGGFLTFKNETGQVINEEISLGNFSNPGDMELVNENGMPQKFRMIKRDTTDIGKYRLFWTPERPIQPEQVRLLGYLRKETQKLYKTEGGYHLRMNNHFGSPVLENFFLVIPSNVEITEQSSKYVSRKQLGIFNVYLWRREVPANTSNTVNVVLATVNGGIKSAESAETPYTQEMFNDIQADGTILFKTTIKQVNQSNREITNTSFINSDFVEVRSMSDAKGRPIEFTSTHEGDIYRYKVTFNEPILAGEVMEYSHEGKITTLVKRLPSKEDEFQYRMTHWPSAGRATRRIETYLLPEGAQLISTMPEDMHRRTKDGRIELHIEKIIPTGSSITTGFKYRLASDKGDSLQSLIDSAKPFDTVVVPKGVYAEPIVITKSLVLKGESANDCVFEVTANKPVIFVDTKGKGQVNIEDLTIKWQLATSDKNTEYPFALGVKDSKAIVRNCNFIPLGNFKRSPVAIKALGFSNVAINTCRFEGFGFAIFCNEGTEGTVENSLIANCQSQGITIFSGATVDIAGNIITGSKKHAVRNTGGTLRMKDNLIINNANRGVYLGNKSAKGAITNNIIMGNGTGISGFANSKVKIHNNVIADSSYAGIGFRPSCRLHIANNILVGNERGWVMFKDEGENGNGCQRNTFWKNKVDVENFKKTANSISANPGFTDFENGDFSLKDGPAKEHKQGLTNPQALKKLWENYHQTIAKTD